jgi:excisionase family DNA binding protein
MWDDLRSKNPAGLDVGKAAELLGLKEPTLRAWVRDRKIEVVRLGRRVKIPVYELRRLTEQGRSPRVERIENRGGRCHE